MENFEHDLSSLFKQLGLADDKESIDAFIAEHGPIPENIKLEDAPCWTSVQADFLKAGLCEDSAWAEVVDQLNVRLR